MMLTYHLMDVFTDTPFSGNPLAIVLGADALITAQMQTLAREFNLSETIFVQAPKDPAHTVKVRIFFPTAEIPFAGHPTIGCAILLASHAMPGGDFTTQIVLEEEAGIVPVTVTRRGESLRAELTAPVLPHAAPGAASVGLVADALGIARAEIGFGTHAVGIWQGGPAFLYVPVASLDTLARARPIQPYWSDLMQGAGVDSAYLYTPAAECDFRARMFSPTAGIPEDPATGSASAILAAQLFAAGVLSAGTSRFILHQGVEMGRPSRIELSVEARPDGLKAVRIAGAAVEIGQGRVLVPRA